MIQFDPVKTFLNKFDQFGSSLTQFNNKGVTNTLNADDNNSNLSETFVNETNA